MISVKKMVNETRKFIEDKDQEAKGQCFKGLYPNFKVPYQLSKRAANEARAIVGLHEKARKLHKVSYCTIPNEI